MAIVLENVCKSKWGYHPCTYEQFMFLKKAHKLLSRANKDCKKWIRWRNKTVYRSPVGPSHPARFVELGFHQSGLKRWSGYGFRRYKGRNLYEIVLEAYRNAKTPVQDPSAVQFIELPDSIMKDVEVLETFYTK